MISESPLVSIIVPAYNVERYIYRCIASLISQSHINIEILICDDGSSDKTMEIISSFSDHRIQAFANPENKGVVFTRNYLLNKASGAYVMLQDADDWSRSDRVGKQLHFLLQNLNYKACGTQFVKIHNEKAISRSFLPTEYNIIYQAIPDTYHFLPGTLMFDVTLLKSIGQYHPYFGNDGNEDLYWVSKMILNYPYYNLNEHLYYYELNVNSLTKLQVTNSRKYYIHHLTARLLDSYKETGSNILEDQKEEQLKKMELEIESTYGQLTGKDIFEKQIGQLIHFKLYFLAMRTTFLIKLHDVSFCKRIRMTLYILRRKLWK